MEINTLNNIINKIEIKLDIKNKELFNSIKNIISEEELDREIKDINKLNQINKLFESDDEINKFEKNNILNKYHSNNVKNNFGKLKNNLGKLQALVLIKHFERAQNADEVLESLLSIFNDKINVVNDILTINIKDFKNQTGGSKDKYTNKYIKYKLKYLLLKNKF